MAMQGASRCTLSRSGLDFATHSSPQLRSHISTLLSPSKCQNISESPIHAPFPTQYLKGTHDGGSQVLLNPSQLQCSACHSKATEDPSLKIGGPKKPILAWMEVILSVLCAQGLTIGEFFMTLLS